MIAIKSHNDYPLQVTLTSNASKAMLRIIGTISQWTANNSIEIGNKADELINSGVKDIHVYIKTDGGDVFEANEIVNIINKFTGAKTGEGGAIVASAGTYIACSLDNFSIAKNGQYMIHKPSMYTDGNIDQITNNLKLLETTTAQYKSLYASKTGLSEDEIEKLWAKGDCWMTAIEAKEKGFVDSIVGDDAVDAQTAEIIRACGAPTVPQITANSNIKDMNQKELAILLGLDENATAEQIKAKIEALKVLSAKAEVLTAQIDAQNKSVKAKEIETILDGAIKNKKFTAEVRDNYKKLLEADFESTKAVIEAMPSVEALSKQINTTGSTTVENRKDWTYQDYLDKDPEALNKMRTEDEPTFDALLNAHYIQ